MTARTCIIGRYRNGRNNYARFQLPTHATITGREDHFALAVHDARMIAKGLAVGDPGATFTVCEVSLGAIHPDRVCDESFDDEHGDEQEKSA